MFLTMQISSGLHGGGRSQQCSAVPDRIQTLVWMYSCSLWRVGGSLKWFSSWRELLEHRAEQSSCRLPLKGAPVLQSPFTCHKAKLCSNLSRRLQLNNMNCSARLLAA